MNFLRNQFVKFLALALIVELFSISALSAEIELSGTYEFLSASVKYLDTGEIVPDIFGKDAKGYIIYAPANQVLPGLAGRIANRGFGTEMRPTASALRGKAEMTRKHRYFRF